MNPPPDGPDRPFCNLDALAAQRPNGDGRAARAHDRLVAGLAALAQEPLPAADEVIVLRHVQARRRAEAEERAQCEQVRRRRREAATALRLRMADLFTLAGGPGTRPFIGPTSGSFALPASVAFAVTYLATAATGNAAAFHSAAAPTGASPTAAAAAATEEAITDSPVHAALRAAATRENAVLRRGEDDAARRGAALPPRAL